MLVTAKFTHQILPPHGVPIGSLRTQLDRFEVEVEGEKVVVVPIIDEESYPEPVVDEDGHEIGEHHVRYHALHSLMAVVRRDVPSLAPGSFDTGPFERRALAALSATLRCLREVTGIVDIDVHAGAVEHDYRDEAGQPLPWWSTHSISFEGVGFLADDGWREVTSRVTQGKDTSLTFELVMEARRFFRQRNYNMAVTNAAVACEVFLYKLVTTALLRQGGISKGSAERLAEEISNRELPALLGCFYELPAEAIASVQKTFGIRNSILHGHRRKPVSREDAQAAIDAAEGLANAEPRQS